MCQIITSIGLKRGNFLSLVWVPKQGNQLHGTNQTSPTLKENIGVSITNWMVRHVLPTGILKT